MLLRVRLIEETFSVNMENKDSKEFRDIAEKITSQVCFMIKQFHNEFIIILWSYGKKHF